MDTQSQLEGLNQYTVRHTGGAWLKIPPVLSVSTDENREIKESQTGQNDNSSSCNDEDIIGIWQHIVALDDCLYAFNGYTHAFKDYFFI